MNEIEDLMVKLHKRNLELGEEKTKAEIKVSKYQKLLSELQPLWLNASNDLQTKIQENMENSLFPKYKTKYSMCGLSPGTGPPKKTIQGPSIRQLQNPHVKTNNTEESWVEKFSRAFSCGSRDSAAKETGGDTIPLEQAPPMNYKPQQRSKKEIKKDELEDTVSDSDSSFGGSQARIASKEGQRISSFAPMFFEMEEDDPNGNIARDVFDPITHSAMIDETNPQPTMEISAAFWQEMLEEVRKADKKRMDLEDAIQEVEASKKNSIKILDEELYQIKNEFLEYKLKTEDHLQNFLNNGDEMSPAVQQPEGEDHVEEIEKNVASPLHPVHKQLQAFRTSLSMEEKIFQASLEGLERLEKKHDANLKSNLDHLQETKQQHDSKFEAEIITRIEDKTQLFAKLDHMMTNTVADKETKEELERIYHFKQKVEKWMKEETEKMVMSQEKQQARYKEEIADLKENYNDSIMKKENEFKSFKEQWKDMENKRDAEIKRLESLVNQKMQEIASLKDLKNDLQKEQQEKKSVINDLRKVEHDKNKLKDEIQNLLKEESNLRTEKGKLQENIKTMKKKGSSVEEKLTQYINKVRDDNENLQEEVERCQEEEEHLQNEIKKLQKNDNISKDALKQLQQAAEAQKKSYAKEIKRLSHTIMVLKEKHYEEFQEWEEEQQKEIKKQKQELDETLRLQKIECEAIERKRFMLENDLFGLAATLKETRSSHADELNNARSDIITRLEDEQKRGLVSSKAITKLELDFKESQEEYHKEKKCREALEGRIDNLTSENEEKQSIINDLEKQLENEKVQKEEFLQQHKETQRQVEKLEKKREILEKQIKTSNENKGDVVLRLQESEELIREFDDKVVAYEEKIEKEQRCVLDLRKQMDLCARRVLTSIKSYEDEELDEMDHCDLEETVDQLEQTLIKERHDLEILEAHIENLITQHTESQSNWATEKGTLENEFAQERKSLREACDEHTEEKKRLSDQHLEEKKRLSDQHAEELEKVQNTVEERQEEILKVYTLVEEKQEEIQKIQNHKEEMREQHMQKIQKMQDVAEEMQDNHEQKIKKLKEKTENIKKEHKNEIQKLDEKHQSVQVQHENEIQKLHEKKKGIKEEHKNDNLKLIERIATISKDSVIEKDPEEFDHGTHTHVHETIDVLEKVLEKAQDDIENHQREMEELKEHVEHHRTSHESVTIKKEELHEELNKVSTEYSTHKEDTIKEKKDLIENHKKTKQEFAQRITLEFQKTVDSLMESMA